MTEIDHADHVAEARQRSETVRARSRNTGGLLAAGAAALTTGLVINPEFTRIAWPLPPLAAATACLLIGAAAILIAASAVTAPSFSSVQKKLLKIKFQQRFKALHHDPNKSTPSESAIREIVSGLGLKRVRNLTMIAQLFAGAGATALLLLIALQAVLGHQMVPVTATSVGEAEYMFCGTMQPSFAGTISLANLTAESASVQINVQCGHSHSVLTVPRGSVALTTTHG